VRRFAHRKTYSGIDSNPAHSTGTTRCGDKRRLIHQDVIDQPPDSGDYDWWPCSGCSTTSRPCRRQAFLRVLADRFAPGGLLAFAAWRFYDIPRFRERISLAG